MKGAQRMTWQSIRDELEASGGVVVVPLDAIEHPSTAGAVAAQGLPVGQQSDWRFPPGADCSGMHVHGYPDRWEAHIDAVHPACSLVDHARVDAPILWLGGGLVVGLAIGLTLGHPWLGALGGTVIAAASLGVR